MEKSPVIKHKAEEKLSPKATGKNKDKTDVKVKEE